MARKVTDKEMKEIYEISHNLFVSMVQVGGRKDIISVGPGFKIKTRKYLFGLITREVPSDELGIVFGVEQKKPENKLSPKMILPKNVGDFKCDVQEVGKIKLLTELTARRRPVEPGYSWGNFRITAGTPGARVKYKGKYFVDTNWHVGKYVDGQVGDNIIQPGAYDGGKNPQDKVGTFAISLEDPSKGAGVHTDYALVEMAEPYTNIMPIINAKPGPWKDHIAGDAILWIGRTSGFGKARISQCHQDVQVGLGGDKTAYFYDTDIFRPPCLAGDSGSWIGEDPYPESTDPSIYSGKVLRTEGKVFAGSEVLGVMIPSRSIQKIYEGIEVDVLGGGNGGSAPQVTNTRLLVSRDGGAEVNFGENALPDANGVYTWADRATSLKLIYPGEHVWRIEVQLDGASMWLPCPEKHTFTAKAGNGNGNGGGEVPVYKPHSEAILPAEGSTVDCSKQVVIAAKVTVVQV